MSGIQGPASLARSLSMHRTVETDTLDLAQSGVTNTFGSSRSGAAPAGDSPKQRHALRRDGHGSSMHEPELGLGGQGQGQGQCQGQGARTGASDEEPTPLRELRRSLWSCEKALEQSRREAADQRVRGDTAVSTARRLRRMLRNRDDDLRESERRRLSRRKDSVFPL